MKRYVSAIVVAAMLAGSVNTSFAVAEAAGATVSGRFTPFDNVKPPELLSEEISGGDIEPDVYSEDIEPVQSDLSGEHDSLNLFSANDYVFNSALLTSFNTVTSPISSNGANEPKYSYNSFLDENISDYSGELTLNFEDLVLSGRNGLDLRIGRTYQSVASNLGDKTLMILPNQNGYPVEALINNYSNYLLDRYNLGMGWGFGFPSVQIETEYEPQEVQDTYYYTEKSELYYHSGNGDVYRVEFTADETDSNLKGYYAKDIQFNKNDTAYSNGQVTSYYSLTLSDGTKQYFAKDGRLIGITDRFSNTIKFEHECMPIVNRVPEGNFKYDSGMWTSSEADDGTYDAVIASDTSSGSKDGCVMKFRRNNTSGDTYILSQPIQVKPLADYTFGIRLKSKYGGDVRVDIIGYDTAYNHEDDNVIYVRDCPTDSWYDFSENFSVSSAVRYIVIKITPDSAEGTLLDTVSLDEPKPIIKKITDSVGRTVDFDYSGDLSSTENPGSVTLSVTSADGTQSRSLKYTRSILEFSARYIGHTEQRMIPYLTSSTTGGDDGATVHYEYKGGTVVDSDGVRRYPKLYSNYKSKVHSSSDGWTNKPTLSAVKYNDRAKIYEYETVRKHLGDDGYYDTLRVSKKYDMYACMPGGSSKAAYKGRVNEVSYSYSGTYGSETFDNETGYPSHTFDDESNLGEKWTVTKSGKDTQTTTFCNSMPESTTKSADGTVIRSDYTNHSVFKDRPVMITNTVTQNGSERKSYVICSYNDRGLLSMQSSEVDETVKNNDALLKKYTTIYEYTTKYNLICKKRFFNTKDGKEACETNVYDSLGRIVSHTTAAGDTTEYRYENSAYPSLVTKEIRHDPMHFNGLMGGDGITEYTYDSTGMYITAKSESYGGGTAVTEYERDAITGDILREANPDGSYTDYTYCSDGKIKRVVSPLTQYADGKQFRTLEIHSYHNSALCRAYPGDDVPIYAVDEVQYYRGFDGDTTAKRYDARINYYDAVGNLRVSQRYDFTAKNEDGSYPVYTTKYIYDSNDRLIKITDNEGNETSYTYNGFDIPTSVTDCENNTYTFEYNLSENTVEMLLNSRKIASQKFDLRGNVTENSVYPQSGSCLSEQYEYDLNNNMVSYTDANGNKTEYVYDAQNRLRKTILPNGVSAQASYSAFDKPAFEKIYSADGEEKSVRTTYRNEKGDVNIRFYGYNKRLTDIDSYTTDSKGRITAKKSGNTTRSITYDELDNPIISASGDSKIYRVYDIYGETASASDNGKISESLYGYDMLGNLAEKKQDGKFDMTYSYSSIGRITKYVAPSGRTENYENTPNGNLKKITTDGKVFEYEYNDAGYVTKVIYPNGMATAYEYDNINRVTSAVTSVGTQRAESVLYEYDSAGNVTKETRNGEATEYTYDSLNRLQSVTYSDGTSVEYEYDALNNRTKDTYSNGDVRVYEYGKDNRLTQVKLNGDVTDTYEYNADGAVVSHNNKTYTYDEWNRLANYSDGASTHSYTYNADGIRTGKDNKQYVVDINNNVVAEADSNGNVTDEIIWGRQPLARKINGSWYYYIYNAHGDVIGLADDSGSIVNTYKYTPWGEIRSETETVDNPIKYAGEYYDDELGMIYLRARYYDPTVGRFISYDAMEGEISNPLDMNRYVYCRNNPVRYVDPSGEFAATATAGAALLSEAVPYIAAGIAATGAILFAEHKRKGTTNPANLPKHQKGQKRKQTDKFGGEKGDARRTPRKDKKK